MAELRADFKSDLLAIARQQLAAEWDAEAQQISDEVVLISFFDSLRRRPAIRPRTLWVSARCLGFLYWTSQPRFISPRCRNMRPFQEPLRKLWNLTRTLTLSDGCSVFSFHSALISRPISR